MMTMELSVTVVNLRAFTNYTFNITASTSAGSGEPATGNFTTRQGSMIYYKAMLYLQLVIYICIRTSKIVHVMHAHAHTNRVI